MKKQLVCTSCPVGCQLEVVIEGGVCRQVTGNACPRGKTYAEQECLRPARMVTTSLLIPGKSLPLSVRSDRPIAKDEIMACLQAIAGIQVRLPVKAGDILLPKVLGGEANIIATRNYD
ncbi:MAG: DUF1667 domain-containing protein [Lentisphaeria bacterium]|jgi:CxxC motif-containing protein|nr:DUF1667 domain-containing protein [Lentisphaeria bacterium]MDY0176065.1 DUF1667 domain-containing protein [Lentisphaeria bacterium]NLZ59110.1 DUF1667 domain-containing protein [Lentisphaerota bacterium]